MYLLRFCWKTLAYPILGVDQSASSNQCNQSQYPLYQELHQPNAESKYSFQATVPGLSNSRKEDSVYQHTFQEQPTDTSGGPLSSWTAQIPGQPNVPPQNYVQMLEQELAISRRKNREYETTSMHLGSINASWLTYFY
jgi:hypothetical protein